MAKVICPNCGKNLDRQSSMTGKRSNPTPGDLAICIYCAEIGIFVDSGAIEVLSDRDMARLMMSPIWEKVMVIRAMIARDHPGGGS